MTPEQGHALDVARALAAAGIPIFLAPADPGSSTGFRLPSRWQETQADPRAADAWQPGMALAAVMGHGLDLLDVDPRSGGDVEALNGNTPMSYAAAFTPSGGVHSFIRSLGLRSRDNVLPGIDVKAGAPDGSGRGFAFIAPTVRPSKVTGAPTPYQWAQAPDLARLRAVLGGELEDTSGDAVRQLISDHRSPASGGVASNAEAPYAGPSFHELPLDQQQAVARWLHATVQGIASDLAAAAEWGEGLTDDRGRGWEKLTADAAHRLGRLARATWNDLTLEDAYMALVEHAPTDESWTLDDLEAKWHTQSGRGVPAPWPDLRSAADREAEGWKQMGFEPKAYVAPAPADGDNAPSDGPAAHQHNQRSLQDAHLAETVANRALRGRYCWSGALGWMRYAVGCWSSVDEPMVVDVLRRDLIANFNAEAAAGADAARLKTLAGTLANSRIRGLLSLTRGIEGVGVAADAFDRHPDLLCVGNGVVRLDTGELLEHDPALLLTKHTHVLYVPGAVSADWATALQAVPTDVVPWLQLRLGQASTGYRTSDDVLPVLQGSGSNGKTTVIGAVVQALQDHAVTIPERVLMAHPSDHPTELMTLRGARLAVIEETPEGRRLSTKRLKDTLGTPTMTARAIRRDNVTWATTHSLLLTTNYAPIVAETDHGTWRRLALVRFPFTFVAPGEPVDGPHKQASVAGIRERLWEGRNGAHEAVLAWLVDGARAWYAANRLIPAPPARVVADTHAWRADSDLVLSYVADRLVVGPSAGACHVMSGDLFDDFTAYVTTRGHHAWTEKTFLTRFVEHESVTDGGVEKQRMRPGAGLSRPPSSGGYVPMRTVPKQYTAWTGVRFRTDADDEPGAAHPLGVGA